MLPLNHVRALNAVLVLAALGACGGGSTTAPPPPAPPPVATFSVGGAVSGLNGTVVLQNNGTNDLSVNANGAFSFASKQAGGTAYSVTIKTQPAAPAQVCVVTQGSGNVASTDVTTISIVCTTTPPPPTGPQWGASSTLADGPVSIGSPSQLAVNAAGDAVATWAQGAGSTRKTVWGAAYHTGTGWSRPQLLRSSEGDADMPQVAIDAKGNAVIAWRDSGLSGVADQRYSMWSVRALRGNDGTVSWNAPVKLPARPDVLPDYSLAMSPGGMALLAWREYFPAGRDTSVARNLAVAEGDGVNWSFAAYPDTADGDVNHPAVAIGASGDAVLTWEQNNDTGASQVLVSRRTGSGLWSLPTTLTVSGGDPGVLAFDPHVVVAGNGKAVAVWRQQYVGGVNQLWTSTGMAGTGWAAGTALTPSGMLRRFSNIDFATNPAGQALLVWEDSLSGYIVARRYTMATDAWGNEQAASAAGDVNDDEPRVAVDGQGRATVIWRHGGGIADIYARATGTDGAWLSTPRRILAAGTDTTSAPQVGADQAGQLLAIWTQCTGSECRLGSSRAP